MNILTCYRSGNSSPAFILSSTAELINQRHSTSRTALPRACHVWGVERLGGDREMWGATVHLYHADLGSRYIYASGRPQVTDISGDLPT